jgi:hypothetical protein
MSWAVLLQHHQQQLSPPTPPLNPLSSAAVEMAPRRRRNTGFIDVRLRPGDHFAAEITAAGVRVWLSTFNTKQEVARAYDTAAWRFARPRHHMNFPEVRSLTEAESLAPESQLRSEGDAQRYRQGQRRIAIAEADERFMAQRPFRRRGNHARILEGEAGGEESKEGGKEAEEDRI